MLQKERKEEEKKQSKKEKEYLEIRMEVQSIWGWLHRLATAAQQGFREQKRKETVLAEKGEAWHAHIGKHFLGCWSMGLGGLKEKKKSSFLNTCDFVLCFFFFCSSLLFI